MQLKSFLAVGAAMFLVGCAGTTKMVINPGSRTPQYNAAYIVTHGGNSSDMDSAITAALMKEHLNVQSGKEGPVLPTQQYVVTYNDDWSWDISMYLQAVSISIHNGANHNIIAHGSWKNSFMHSFPDVNEVVGELVHKLFQKVYSSHSESVSQASDNGDDKG